MKKLFLIILLGGFFFPLIILAGSYRVNEYTCPPSPPRIYIINYEGLVPCGRCLPVTAVTDLARADFDNECGQVVSRCALTNVKFMKCTVCHFFVMIDGIVDLILLKIVPSIGTLILIFAGIAFYQAGQNPEKYNKARSVLLSVIIGLTIIYTSWIVVNTTLKAVGIADWVGFGEGWFQISCDVEY